MDFTLITEVFIRDFLIWFQIVTAITATIYSWKYSNTDLRYFVLLLWYTVLNDFVALYYYSKTIDPNNSILYNIYQVVSFSYFLWLYRRAVQQKNSRRIVTVFLPLYLLSVAISLSVHDVKSEYLVIPYLVGAGFVLINIVLYFIEILNSDTIIYINQKLLFWISVALLFLYTGSIPLMVARHYYSDSPTIPYILNVNYFLNFLVNLLYISGIIWSGKDQKD